jgi:hypothetical protein
MALRRWSSAVLMGEGLSNTLSLSQVFGLQVMAV